MPCRHLARRQSHQVYRRLLCPLCAPRKGRGVSGDLQLLGPSPASSHRVLASVPRSCPAVPGAGRHSGSRHRHFALVHHLHDSHGTPWHEHHDRPHFTSHGTGLSRVAAPPFRWPYLLPGMKRPFLGHCNNSQVTKEICFRLYQPVLAENPPKPTS